MRLPIVTVIITYHNEGENLLHQAIDSVNTQTYDGEIEIIVVDDASRISPLLPLDRRYTVSLVRSERNIFAAAARNLGLSHSIGEVVAFLDADDVYLPDKIRKEVTALLQLDKAVMVGGQGIIDEFGNRCLYKPSLAQQYFGELQTFSARLLPEVVRLDICMTYLFHTCGFVARRSVLESIGGFDESNCWWGEEWDLQIRLAQIGRIGYVPVPGYCYIKRKTSTTQIENPLKQENLVKISQRHRHNVKGLTVIHKRKMKEIESKTLLLATQIHLEQFKDPKSGWRCAWQSLWCKPSVWGFRSLIRSTLHLLISGLRWKY